MSKQRPTDPGEAARAVTPERAARLYRLIQILAAGPQTRDALRRRLSLDVRSFYRDLELLRASGIEVPMEDRRYRLVSAEAAAVALLPFPDPRLRLGEVVQLAKGKTAVHRKLRQLLDDVVQPAKKKRG
jgi:predicted DNA-binding transcriptional regulator YafY